MTTSLVTGGAGFLGSHVAKYLLGMGHKVIILDDLSGGFIENLPLGYLTLPPLPVKWYNEPQGTLISADCLFIHGSILDAHLVDHLVAMYKPDYIYHLAAYAAESLSHHVRCFNYENNLVGSVNLINAAVNVGCVKRFVFTSSIAVYGLAAWYAKEDQAPTPADPYGIAKCAVEMDLKAAHDLFGLDYTIFRPHNCFGPRQSLSDGYRNVIGIFFRQCLNGQPMTIFGDGNQAREFTFIDDVAPHIARCVEIEASRNETINVGGDTPYTVKAISTDVANALRLVPQVVYLPERHEAHHAYADHAKFVRIFGYPELTGLREGIQKTATWARAQPLRQTKPFAAIEVERGLPESWRHYAGSTDAR